MAFWRPGSALPGIGGGDDGSSESALDGERPGVLFNPLHRLPLHVQRQRLPVFAHRDEILYAVETHATTILVGATGSGKTTQVPQYLLEAGWAARNRKTGAPRMIVCTQPRRIAATTIAERVAHEVGSPLGTDVGYAVRFDERWDPQHTKLKFCTDGVLLREILTDPLLSRYSVIMLDEAHERSIETDLLLGLLKKIQKRRPLLRIIIASATLDVDMFLDFFRSPTRHKQQQPAARPTNLHDVVAVSVEGRQFPVDVQYLEEPCSDFIAATIATVLAIDQHERATRGDILVFLPGRDEIECVVEALAERAGSRLVPLPLYAALPLAMQQTALTPLHSSSNKRKVIVATTIAETSVTIDNVAFVVDCCFTKLRYYNPLADIESLGTTLISKAAAAQRAGRAGRQQPGKCFRLVPQAFYEAEFPNETRPQIQRTRLTTIVLLLFALGVDDVAHFEFLTPPSAAAVAYALADLHALGAISDTCRMIEPLGTLLATFPVAPHLAKAILASLEYNSIAHVLTIASVLAVDADIFQSATRGTQLQRARVVDAIGVFADRDGDLLTYWNVLVAFVINDKRRSWCDDHKLNYRTLVKALEVRSHLQRFVKRVTGSFKLDLDVSGDVLSDSERQAILQSFTAGYFQSAAKRHHDGTYRTICTNRVIQIHPTSVFCYSGVTPEWLLYCTSVETNALYGKHAMRIDPRWLLAAAPSVFQTTDVSAALSGSSGTIGLPFTRDRREKKKHKKDEEDAAAATATDGRILFRKPVKRVIPSGRGREPVTIGKRKGGLRSQF